ncbi:hypothetical protein DMH04_23610 [Kibdelosporangium aridum]|uniref:Uncharacterized protein n=1 Tax=Kibdelosporangium aridum TaxID=2030 RepID=A0A428Z6V3_KIBAR|nr:hypothetical protein [Kibdelosporangium aridum]RSM83132.1 hypothetical protein DMH04_23610 [Kibdelosporangium aridum]
MTTLEREKQAALTVFGEVEELEEIAGSLPPGQQEQSDRLTELASRKVASMPPLRPGIVAALLKLSEPTVRAWLRDGILKEASPASSEASVPATTRLDPVRVHQVLHLVNDLRARGKKRHLVDLVWARLQDEAVLEREDMRQSLEQFRSGDTIVLRPRK